MKNSFETVYINPIQRVSVQGRDKRTFRAIDFTTGQVKSFGTINQTKAANSPTELMFPYDPSKNRMVTGLDELIPNPFQDLTADQIRSEYGVSGSWSTDRLSELSKQKTVKLQTVYEIYDNVKEDFYTSEVYGGTIFSTAFKKTTALQDPSFIQTFKVILYDRPNVFKSNTQRGRLAIQAMKVHNKVANSREEINPSYHLFYISEKNEAERDRIKKQDIINEGTYWLYKLQKEFTDEENYKIAILLTDKDGRPRIKGEVPPITVKDALNRHVSRSGSDQIRNINQFLELTSLLENREGANLLHIRYLVQQAINCNVISVRDGYYIWHKNVEHPNTYKFTTREKLINLLKREFETFNEEDTSITNWYGQLLDELKVKGVKC